MLKVRAGRCSEHTNTRRFPTPTLSTSETACHWRVCMSSCRSCIDAAAKREASRPTSQASSPELGMGFRPSSQKKLSTMWVWRSIIMSYTCFNERWEGRKKEASKVKQTTRQSNTAYPRRSLFLRKMSCLTCTCTLESILYIVHLIKILCCVWFKTIAR